MSEAKSLVLRFRDLVTGAGETITQHKSIIESQTGFVWWGWWNKPGERIADEEFRRLNAEAIAHGLEVFLYDSGHNKVYKATCNEIKWDANHSKISSPEPSATPAYYNSQKYLLWFKLTSVAEVGAAALKELTCVQVDEFFESRQSRYDVFYNKRIHSPDELRQQNRTIWFVRQFRDGDKTHEVSLLDARAIAPVHFAHDFKQTESTKLLWVSDLHFSVDGHHAFPIQSDHTHKNLAHALEQAVGQLKIGNVAGVIVSGDITWKADQEEFKQAAAFCERVMSWSKLDSYAFAICPGNHDVAFSSDPSDKASTIQVGVAPEKSKESFAKFYEGLFYISPNKHLSSGRRFLLGGAFPVEIVCLNSSFLDQKKGWFQGNGFIGDEQLQSAANDMGWTAESLARKPYRIVVLHHHVVPVTYHDTPVGGTSYSVTLDAEALSRWVVEHRVDLVLHGHMHQPFWTQIVRPRSIKDSLRHGFYVAGMGSTGVAKQDVGEVGKNTFGVLEFSYGLVRFAVYSVDKTTPAELLAEVEFQRDNSEHR